MRQRGTASQVDPDYERWLNKTLHEMYDPILREPIPEELARLLSRFEDRPDEPSEQD